MGQLSHLFAVPIGARPTGSSNAFRADGRGAHPWGPGGYRRAKPSSGFKITEANKRVRRIARDKKKHLRSPPAGTIGDSRPYAPQPSVFTLGRCAPQSTTRREIIPKSHRTEVFSEIARGRPEGGVRKGGATGGAQITEGGAADS